MIKAYFFTQPSSAKIELLHDSGKGFTAIPDTHPSGRACQAFHLPDDIAFNAGCQLTVTAEDKVAIILRGILVQMPDGFVYVLCDTFNLVDEIKCPEIPPTPEPPPNLARNPLSIAKLVYSTGLYDLSTKSGCGRFTEAVCEECHDLLNQAYGHIRKFGAQNNYNGHAVDAIQVLRTYTNPDGTATQKGIYDLIISSESPDAEPSFNYKGEPEPSLWYYPA